ncbi:MULTISPECIES: HAD family hydrolase [Agrobacterium]|uniref:HAD family phosphatase n=1 Tax=Agrobacterium rubi TaxID=28099 RepID=A0AAE7RFW3_9HYPH|nr:MULTISPECIES: HAD family phosphatase [Agrobacterium]MBN7808918.1 HAD family phosphatase [Agrobacterium rosae]NTE90207.1 HAD family phosphatase [Agrobacterium rubi]NTF06026.1 HAD family phosphatase [Agrobacterium rubi]NTF40265.1 HAD family phosphatase [Agrobacterium rubi]OCJ53053.1 HAD family hydrolase [Agrobacterium rubi]
MNDVELVIFDCDGVLVDSEILGITIETELLGSAGYDASVPVFTERFSGMSWRDILAILEAESGLSLMDELLDKTETELDIRIPKEVEAVAGIRAALEELQLPKCVCSNTKLPRVTAMLDRVGLREFFGPNIFSAKDLGEGRSKPKPDIFLFGASTMGVDPVHAVVVEDSVHGVHAARSAGMRVIGFTGGKHTFQNHAHNLRNAGAHIIVSHMCDLPSAIAEIN